MPKKRYNAEVIIHKLREADVLLDQDKEADFESDVRSASEVYLRLGDLLVTQSESR